MKFNKILVAGLAACLFTACSNDELPGSDPNALYDAAINLAVVPSAGSLTRTPADGGTDDGTPNEQKVNKLTAFVFDGVTGALVATKEVSDSKTIGEIIVKAPEAGKNYKLFLATNLTTGDPLYAISNVSGLTTIAEDLANESEANLKMTSNLLTVNIKGLDADRDAGKITQNYINNADGSTIGLNDAGKTTFDLTATPKVPVTRLVARIQFEQIAFTYTNDANAKFNLKSVYLANIASKSLTEGASLFQGNAFWHATDNQYAAKSGNIAAGTNKYTDGTTITPVQWRKDYATPKVLNQGGAFTDLTSDMMKGYVYENTVTDATLLLIKGFITLGNGTIKPDTYYQIVVKHSDADKYVVRNTIYKIKATITGDGSPDEPTKLNNAGINAQVTVAPWKVINQTENDVN